MEQANQMPAENIDHHTPVDRIDKNLTAEKKEQVEEARMANMDSLVGYILLVGVVLSATLIVGGTLWNWILSHHLTVSFSISGENYFDFLVTSLRRLFTDQIQPSLLIRLGIATLMLTPFLRVLASVFYFALVDRNWKYTLFTMFVCSVLTYSLFLR